MRVALEGHVLRHAHRTEVADAANIVAPEIDEHHVLGTLLLTALQFLGEAKIVLVIGATRPSARDRVRLDPPAFDPDEHLGARADDRQLPHAHEIHVGDGFT